MGRWGRRKRKRWQGPVGVRPTGLSLLRGISRFSIDRPPEGLPGFAAAALPFVLVLCLAWRFPGFWQVPAVVTVGVVVGILILRVGWSARVKTAFATTVVAMSALAFAASGTDVGPFVLPLIAVSFLASLLRARLLERDAEERDAWRQE